MVSFRKFAVIAALFAGGVFNPCFAAYLDFTDNGLISSLTPVAGGFGGSIDGVGFTLTSADGTVNFNESYDGSAGIGCASGGGTLACDRDGAGIGNDEVTGLSGATGQILTLAFDSLMSFSGFELLDLYRNINPELGGEQARILIDGATLFTVDATGSAGDGGYASLDLLALGGPIIGQTVQFTAYLGNLLQDDRDNDFAVAAISVSAVPVPAAAWLFGTALIGLIGFNRRRSAA